MCGTDARRHRGADHHKGPLLAGRSRPKVTASAAERVAWHGTRILRPRRSRTADPKRVEHIADTIKDPACEFLGYFGGEARVQWQVRSDPRDRSACCSDWLRAAARSQSAFWTTSFPPASTAVTARYRSGLFRPVSATWALSQALTGRIIDVMKFNEAANLSGAAAERAARIAFSMQKRPAENALAAASAESSLASLLSARVEADRVSTWTEPELSPSLAARAHRRGAGPQDPARLAKDLVRQLSAAREVARPWEGRWDGDGPMAGASEVQRLTERLASSAAGQAELARRRLEAAGAARDLAGHLESARAGDTVLAALLAVPGITARRLAEILARPGAEAQREQPSEPSSGEPPRMRPARPGTFERRGVTGW